MLCHGNTTIDGGHCCFVQGQPCPNLLRGQEVADAVDALVALYGFKGPANNLAKRIGDGITNACHVALKVIAESIDTTSQLPDRAAFEAGWTAHADYQPVADAWESIGRPRSWCVTYGPPEQQCCFSEDQATNDARAAGIPVQVRNLRAQISGG